MSITLTTGPQPDSVALTWRGGLTVDHPAPTLRPGQASQGLKVLDFRFVDNHWELVVEGVAGNEYAINLRGESISRVEGATLLDRHDDVSTISISIPEGDGTHELAIVLHRE